MSYTITLDFFHTLEKQKEGDAEATLYINIQVNFFKGEDGVETTFSIQEDMSSPDISHLIKLINPDLYQEILTDVEIAVEKGVIEAVEEWTSEYIY